MSARILIIEDNPANMELMVYLLKAFGHAPLFAHDGMEGIEAARRDLPDLIICDVNLPKMDGYGVVRNLKSHPALRAIPVIAVTALAMVGDREKLLDAGFDGYIGKPIEPETFVGQVEKFMRDDLRSLREPVAATAAVATALTVGTTTRDCILVVDDSSINRDLIRNILEPFGYRLSLAVNARQGRERATQEEIDLILCDLHMPGEDGIDFIRSIKAEPRLVTIPFLFISAGFEEGDLNHRLGLQLGASGFLHRPIEPPALIDAIETCLAQSVKQQA